jgi:hypothetical protein
VEVHEVHTTSTIRQSPCSAILRGPRHDDTNDEKEHRPPGGGRLDALQR